MIVVDEASSIPKIVDAVVDAGWPADAPAQADAAIGPVPLGDQDSPHALSPKHTATDAVRAIVMQHQDWNQVADLRELRHRTRGKPRHHRHGAQYDPGDHRCSQGTGKVGGKMNIPRLPQAVSTALCWRRTPASTSCESLRVTCGRIAGGGSSNQSRERLNASMARRSPIGVCLCRHCGEPRPQANRYRLLGNAAGEVGTQGVALCRSPARRVIKHSVLLLTS